MAARARVARRYERPKVTREGIGALHARDPHHPFLERLSQALQRGTVELTELIKEQDAVMGKRGFLRPA